MNVKNVMFHLHFILEPSLHRCNFQCGIFKEVFCISFFSVTSQQQPLFIGLNLNAKKCEDLTYSFRLTAVVYLMAIFPMLKREEKDVLKLEAQNRPFKVPHLKFKKTKCI